MAHFHELGFGQQIVEKYEEAVVDLLNGPPMVCRKCVRAKMRSQYCSILRCWIRREKTQVLVLPLKTAGDFGPINLSHL